MILNYIFTSRMRVMEKIQGARNVIQWLFSLSLVLVILIFRGRWMKLGRKIEAWVGGGGVYVRVFLCYLKNFSRLFFLRRTKYAKRQQKRKTTDPPAMTDTNRKSKDSWAPVLPLSQASTNTLNLLVVILLNYNLKNQKEFTIRIQQEKKNPPLCFDDVVAVWNIVFNWWHVCTLIRCQDNFFVARGRRGIDLDAGLII